MQPKFYAYRATFAFSGRPITLRIEFLYGTQRGPLKSRAMLYGGGPLDATGGQMK